MKPTAKEVIAKARKDLGLGEPNYIQKWYAKRNKDVGGYWNWAWCNAATTWWQTIPGKEPLRPDFAYTVACASWYKKKGQWHYGTAGIRAGDEVFFDWKGSHSISSIDHVGLVERVSGSKIYTIEGNIGDRCQRKVRDKSYIVGYGRPKYEMDKPSRPSTTKPSKIVPWGDSWPFKPGTNIKKGWEKSRTVARLQVELNRLGYVPKLVVDGDYGDMTDRAVRAFQFAVGYKPWSGVGKYTWRKLLAAKTPFVWKKSGTQSGWYGLDYAWSKPSIAKMLSKRVKFVIRYLSYDKTGKTATKKEVLSLRNKGIKVGFVWETTANRAGKGFAAGVSDAREALKQLSKLGAPNNVPVYFAVDYDANPATVDPYFRGVLSVTGVLRVGAYGSYKVVKYLKEHKLISFCWQTYAWSGGKWYSGNHIEQYKTEISFDGADVDFNRTKKDYCGLW